MVTLNPSVSVDVDTTLTGTGSTLNNLNLLQPTAFKLLIDRKNFPNLEFFCQSVALPAMSADATELQFQRVSTVPMPGDKLTFGELECIIIVDENLNSYTEMYNWLQRTVQTNVRSPLDRVDNLPPTYCDVSVAILNSNNNITRKVKYIDAIPTAIGNLIMETTTGDTTQLTFPVTFRYSYFELA